MKKLSNNNGVIKSSTLAGQRELLREYRNKINEMIEEYDARFQTHEYRINSIAEDKGETMKSIQEKIQPKDYSEVLKEIKKVMDNHTGLALLTSLKFFIDKHNSLIDVLTEQQKEIEKDNKYFTRLFEELTECIQLIQKQVDEQPYTAMRSTGENRCSNPMPHEFGSLPCCEGIISIKPQEDILEKLAKYLFNEVWSQQNIIWEEQVLGVKDEWYEKADRILAIVKGE